MNKLFTKVAALTLGVAMAAGVGVALGASKVSEAKAASGDCTIAKGTNAYDDNTINGKFAIKAGASSKQGSMTITIPEAKAKTLSFYACAWSGDATGVDLSSSGVTLSESSLTLTNDSSLSGTGSAWTLANDEETYYFELSLTNCTANAVVTLTAHQASKNRFFVWGASYDDGESGQTVDVTGVELDQEAIELTIPEQQSLVATVSPNDATNKKVTWTSSNPEVATASNGVVKALDAGKTTVTVTTQDGSFTDSCEVTVSLPTITNATVAEAISIGSALANGATSSEYYKVTGYVVAITYPYSNGTMSFTMADEKSGSSTVTCYKVACSEQTAANIVVDKRVALVGNIQNYYKSNVNTYEIVNNIVSQTSFPGEPTPAPTLESIAVSGTYKTSYEIGEEFDPAGIVVTATYSDQSQQVVTTGIEYSGFSSETAGQKTITVTYEGKTTTFNVTVNAPAPVTYSVTYKAGDGQGTDHVVSNIEAGSKHALVSFAQSEFVAPEGKQFKAWSVDSVEQQPGYEVTVNSNLVITAVYEDIPAPEDWDEETVGKFELSLNGFVPPYYGDVVGEITFNENNVIYYVAGDKTSQFESYFAVGWTFNEQGGYYAKDVEGGTLCGYASLYQENTYVFFQFDVASEGWDSNILGLFTSVLHGVIPTYDDSVAALAYNSEWNDFELDFTTVEAAQAQVDTLCKDWELYDQGEKPFYYTYSADGLGYARGYVYISGDAGSATIDYVQVHYAPEKEAEFSSHLDGFVPVYDDVFNAMKWQTANNQFYFGYYGEYSEYFVQGFKDSGMTVYTQTQSGADVYYIQTEHGKVFGYSYEIEDGGEPVTYAFMWYQADPIPTSLSIDISGAKTQYYVGDELDISGLVINVLDENGNPMYGGQNAAQYCSYDYDFSAAGQAVVNVRFQVSETGYVYGSFEVEVSEAPVSVYTAEDFAHDFLEFVSPICSNYDGKKNNKEALRGVWTTMAQRYSTLSNEEKAKVIQAAGKAGGSELERAMAFYDYACKKYGLTKFVNDRTPHALVLETTESNSIVPIIAIIAASIAAVTAIGVIIAYRRRKALIK